ncbi:MAG: GntR family transcriptional regulator [Mangrovicoccus sp.]
MQDKTEPLGLDPIPERRSAADIVFDELHRRILSLDLKPGTKMSEIEVAKQAGVSRQPVRDAFWRLSQLGFLEIRPQRATLITKISERAVKRARFIRTALEVEIIRTACETFTDEDIAAIEALIKRQDAACQAGDKEGFHALDDYMHQEICRRAGVLFAWDLIHVQKSHMDRVRYLSLSFASEQAYSDHVELLAALKERDADKAADIMRGHLSRIDSLIGQIRVDHSAYFEGEAG